MSSSLQEFLAARLPFPGLVAWSARLPDHTVASQSYVRWLPGAAAEQMLGRLALSADALRQHRLDPIRLCWVFENLRLHFALREDGTCIGLAVQSAQELASPAAERVLADFGNLTS